jgi:hypothetical protein
MKKRFIVKGTPIVPSLCGIAMAVLWYMFFYFYNGKWSFQMSSLSFSEMGGTEIYFTIVTLLIPVAFFLTVLFLAEVNLRWMVLALLIPIVHQISSFVLCMMENQPEYLFENIISFSVPFLALILWVLTVEKVLSNKWIFVGFCGVAVLLPLILTLCGVGEYTFVQQTYDVDYNVVTLTGYLWSDYLAFALYYVGFGALAIQMRTPTAEELAAEESSRELAEESQDDARDAESSQKVSE